MAGEENKMINGRVFPMEDYGTMGRGPVSDDRVNILQEDELVCAPLSLTP